MDTLFATALEQVLAQHCSPALVRALEARPASEQTLWTTLQACGFADCLLPEAQGGAELSLSAVYPLIELMGRYALPYPMAETLLGRGWLAQAGLACPSGALVFAHASPSPQGLHTAGVRGARLAQAALLECEGQVRLLPIATATLQADIFALDARLHWSRQDWEHAPLLPGLQELRLPQAALYAAMLAGAMLQLLERTLSYANQRQQFGKPIAKFQAIQHQLSVMAEQIFAARMSAQLAYTASPALQFEPLRAAVAKARCSAAALEVAALSHSIHGAIGFTAEYDLQLYTRRLHLWRQTAGSESYWQDRVGQAVLAQPGLALDLIRQASD